MAGFSVRELDPETWPAFVKIVEKQRRPGRLLVRELPSPNPQGKRGLVTN